MSFPMRSRTVVHVRGRERRRRGVDLRRGKAGCLENLSFAFWDLEEGALLPVFGMAAIEDKRLP